MIIEVVNTIESRVNDQGAKHLAPILSFTSSYWRKGQWGMRRFEYQKPLIKKAKDGYHYFLTGFVPRVAKQFPSATIKIMYDEPVEKFFSPKLEGIIFRPDQRLLMQQAITAKRGLIQSPTGSGKTVLQMGIISAMPKDFCCLILAHTKDIVSQTCNELVKFGFKPQMVMEGNRVKLHKSVVVATIQTMVGYSVDEYMTYFDMVMVDECFAKGTKIQTENGGKPIENVKIGELVETKEGLKKVTHVFIEKINLTKIVRVNLNNGKHIICSDEHLFLNSNAIWVKSKNLKPNQLLTSYKCSDMMVSITSKQGDKSDGLPQIVRSAMSNLSRMVSPQSLSPTVLFKRMCLERHKKKRKFSKTNERNQSEKEKYSFRKNEIKKSNEQPPNKRKNDKHKKSQWDISHFFWGSWWKWTSNTTTKAISFCSWLVGRGGNTFGGENSWLSNQLQSRCGQRKVENSHRSRWGWAQIKEKANEGHKENSKTETIRVESVEIYQQGNNDKSFVSVVSNKERNQGYIELFDIEVEGSHTYFAEGVLVHNSHHVSNFTGNYHQVLSTLLAPYRYAFTATKSPNKEAEMALEGLIGPTVARLTINEAAALNIIAKPKLRLIKLPENHSIRQTCRSYDEVVKHGIVGSVARTEKICNLVQNGFQRGKVSLVMVNQVDHGHKIQAELKERGLDIPFVHGITDGLERVRIKEKLINKKLLAAICTTVWSEGVNIPSINVIILAHLGKSELKTLQNIGRGLRRTDDKDKVIIVDFFDSSHNHLIKHFGERLCLYMDEGWI